MNDISQPQYAKPISWMRRGASYVAILLFGLAAGFLPMWAKSRTSATSLSEATSRASLATMQNALASAAIDAQRGDYESARQAASDFFTSLREEANKGDGSLLSVGQRGGIEPLFAQRDELISLLARNDPAGTERLFDLYVSFRELMGK